MPSARLFKNLKFLFASVLMSSSGVGTGSEVFAPKVVSPIGCEASASPSSLAEPVLNDKKLAMAAVAPNCRFFVAAKSSGEIGLYRFSDGRYVKSVGELPRLVSIQLSLDGTLALTVSREVKDENRVALWHLDKSTPVSFIGTTNARVVAFDPFQRWALLPKGNAIQMRSLDGKRTLGVFTIRGAGDGISALRVSPDGEFLAAGLRDGSVHLLNYRTGKEVSQLPASGTEVAALDFMPDHRFLLVANERARIWDMVDGKVVHEYGPSNQLGEIVDSDLSEDGSKLLVVGSSGRVSIYDEAGEELLWLRGEDGLTHAEFAPGAKWIFAVAKGGIFRWPVQD